MIQTLNVIKSEYGGVENYVKEVCGLTDEDIRIIRNRLLAKGDGYNGIGLTWSHVSRL